MINYIHTIASISHQDSFRNSNVYAALKKIDAETDVVAPDYKEFVPPAALRRLSPVLRMGLTTAVECQNNTSTPFDAISVGTALGCLRDTERFLVTIHTSTSDTLSPTAFIQSTHNTIGGQISLGLGNHAYNMTHTQNGLSFEVALLDALLCLNEGKKNVLVGAAEEKIDFLENLRPSLIPDNYPLSSGATFMALSYNKNNSGIGIKSVDISYNDELNEDAIHAFLADNDITLNDIDLILHSDQLPIETEAETINYLTYTGMHYSASAFAVHVAHDYLANSDKKHVLILNSLCKGRSGMMLVEK